MKKIKVIIAEDQPVMRRGYISLFSDYTDICLIGEAENGKELLDLLKKKTPDIILLDLEMPVMNGAKALNEIALLYPQVKIIIVSVHNEEEYIIDFYKKGVNAYITKNKTADCIIDAIYTVYKTGFYIVKEHSELLITKRNNEGVKFTEREMEIILMVAIGKSNKEMSNLLNVSNIYRKTQTFNSGGLTTYAYNHGLIKKAS